MFDKLPLLLFRVFANSPAVFFLHIGRLIKKKGVAQLLYSLGKHDGIAFGRQRGPFCIFLSFFPSFLSFFVFCLVFIFFFFIAEEY